MHKLTGLAFYLLAVVIFAPQSHGGEWHVAGFSFSDELGGFDIVSVRGSGTDADPIVVVQRQHIADPVTMVIRPLEKPYPNGEMKRQAFVNFSLVVAVTNGSNRNWAGMDLELQEIRGKPSIYHDGLSFDQLKSFKQKVFRSDKFASFSDLIEPYDRIRFEDGHVVPADTVRLKVYITDVTPTNVFYLVQDPQILMAQAPQDVPTRFARAKD